VSCSSSCRPGWDTQRCKAALSSLLAEAPGLTELLLLLLLALTTTWPPSTFMSTMRRLPSVFSFSLMGRHRTTTCTHREAGMELRPATPWTQLTHNTRPGTAVPVPACSKDPPEQLQRPACSTSCETLEVETSWPGAEVVSSSKPPTEGSLSLPPLLHDLAPHAGHST
jgi:hypothetical protein